MCVLDILFSLSHLTECAVSMNPFCMFCPGSFINKCFIRSNFLQPGTLCHFQSSLISKCISLLLISSDLILSLIIKQHCLLLQTFPSHKSNWNKRSPSLNLCTNPRASCCIVNAKVGKVRELRSAALVDLNSPLCSKMFIGN